MSVNKLLVLIGSGPGIGVSTASLFASHGFKVALLSRNTDRLKEDAAKVQKKASSPDHVQTFTADASDHVALRQVLDKVNQTMGPPLVVVYNAARVGPSQIGEFTPDELLLDYKLNNVGQYVAATWALPFLTEQAKHSEARPSFLLSGSGINFIPPAPFFSLAMQKAAQSNFLKSLKQVAGPQGVHVARVDINGLVSPDNKDCTPDMCAEQHWKLYEQKQGQWDDVVEVGDMVPFAKALGVEILPGAAKSESDWLNTVAKHQ